MANKYSEQDLQELYALAQREGTDALERGKKIALVRFARSNGLSMPGRVPTEVAAPPVVDKPKPTPSQSKPRGDELEVVRSMRWYEDWPVDAIARGSTRQEPKYSSEARMVRDSHGRIARLATGLVWKRARILKGDINSGNLKAFLPKHSFEARLLQEDGLWSVLVKYVGGEDE